MKKSKRQRTALLPNGVTAAFPDCIPVGITAQHMLRFLSKLESLDPALLHQGATGELEGERPHVKAVPRLPKPAGLCRVPMCYPRFVQ